MKVPSRPIPANENAPAIGVQTGRVGGVMDAMVRRHAAAAQRGFDHRQGIGRPHAGLAYHIGAMGGMAARPSDKLLRAVPRRLPLATDGAPALADVDRKHQIEAERRRRRRIYHRRRRDIDRPPIAPIAIMPVPTAPVAIMPLMLAPVAPIVGAGRAGSDTADHARKHHGHGDPCDIGMAFS
jgi:hypothetical protein